MAVTSTTQIFQQAEKQLAQAKAELAAAQEQSKAAREREENALARVREMQTVWDWLQLNGRKEEREASSEATKPAEATPAASGSAATPPEVRFGRPVPEVTQADLCLRALASFGRAASTKEIRDRVAQDGHELSMDQIRGTLKYLSRKKPPPVETSTGSGVWRLVHEHAAVGGRIEPEGTVAMNGTGSRPSIRVESADV